MSPLQKSLFAVGIGVAIGFSPLKNSKYIEFIKQTISHRNLDTTSAYVKKLSDQEIQKCLEQLE
jgi:hypothetical protein